MIDKICVKGEEIHPLYKFLTEKEKNGLEDNNVKWNFQKFLISKTGTVISSISNSTSVTEAEVVGAVEKALKE